VIALGPQACGSLAEASSREWLVADGLGGYASGTVASLRTRRYHGLLVQAAGGPSARMLGLAALDPVLVVGDARHRLATDEWASGAVDPRGLTDRVDLARGEQVHARVQLARRGVVDAARVVTAVGADHRDPDSGYGGGYTRLDSGTGA